MKKLFILITIFLLGTSVFAEEMTKSQQAVALYNDNNILNAMKVLISIPEADKTAQDWLLMGNILQDENKISEAEFMFKRAILVDKNFYKPYYNLANIYLDEERVVMALDNYKIAVKLKPDFVYGYYNMGCAYLRLGEYKKARKYFVKTISVASENPDKTEISPDFYYNLAFCYKKLNNTKKAKEALAIYDKLIENK